jgi:hypothetical protein
MVAITSINNHYIIVIIRLVLSSSPTTAQSQLPYREFVDSIRSPASRTLYLQALHYFMDYLRIPRDNYDKLLDKDPKLIQMDITDFIKYLRSKNLSYATISSYVSAITNSII